MLPDFALPLLFDPVVPDPLLLSDPLAADPLLLESELLDEVLLSEEPDEPLLPPLPLDRESLR